MEHKPLRVAIIGGGIGGLSLAVCLGKLILDHRTRLIVDVYESTSSLEAQVGAGIGLWPSSWGVCESLGIDKELAKYVEGTISDKPEPFMKIRKSDEAEGRDLFTLWSKAGTLILFHRADLQSVLLRNTPPSFTIHTKKRLRSYSQDEDEVALHFEDGSTAYCDLVIGADGLQSRVRRTMIEEFASQDQPTKHGSATDPGRTRNLRQLSDPYWSGIVVYRGLIPRQKFIDAGWGHHRVFSGNILDVGTTGTIMAYPVSNNTMVSVAALRMWPNFEGSVYDHSAITKLLEKGAMEDTIEKESRQEHDSTTIEGVDPWADNGGGGNIDTNRPKWVCKVAPSEVKEAFKGWEPDIQVLLDHLDEPLCWALHSIHPLPKYVSGKVCLIGDAAHAMLSHLGQGAGQAICDAFVLAKLVASAISDHSLDTKIQLGASLNAYDAVRRPVAQKVAAMSKLHALYWTLLSRDDSGRLKSLDTRNNDDLDILWHGMSNNWAISWDKRSPFEEVEKAIGMLKHASF